MDATTGKIRRVTIHGVSCWIFLSSVLATSLLMADSPASCDEPSESEKSRIERIQQALERGLTVVQRAADNYPKHRQCFSCHHQTLPMLSMKSVKKAGLDYDRTIFQEQLEFTRNSFDGRQEVLRAGEHVGGRAATVGYGLWTLEIAEAQTDELSAAMVSYLLKHQADEGYWRPPSNRPPLEESLVTCTVLAANGIRLFCDESQREAVQEAVARAKKWLATAEQVSQEDKVGRLWGLWLLDGSEEEMEAARKVVLAEQKPDGGWSQLPAMDSDSYATGMTLYVLRQTGVSPEDEAMRRGIDFLLKTQCEDGSWFIETRSKPVQLYFDNGDPHGKNQFISISGTAWAVTALAESVRHSHEDAPEE